MSKITPGPWKAEVSMLTGAIVVDSPSRPICMLGGNVTGANKDEPLANADLIAAAPDLLQACTTARAILLDARAFMNRGKDEVSTLFNQLNKAIDKAEGKEAS